MGRQDFLPGVGWGGLVGVGPCNLLICVILRGEVGKRVQRMGKSGGRGRGMIIEYLKLIFMIIVFWLCGDL